ncbi:MAG: ATP-binding cassette domain-containing protein [Peptoniphilaceae bacterium]|jgi:zinc transport system ATP-binding protein
MTLLHCENLRFAYDGCTVCHNINFTLQTGDYLCIVGENGSGKSTLMKGILQLKKPSGGTLRMATALKADQIGYLPQQTDRQKDCPAVVQEVVLSGCLNRLGPRPFYGKKEKALAAKKNGAARHIASAKAELPRSVGRPETTGPAGSRAVCNQTAPRFGRTDGRA